jgi:glucose-1-phosphate adenylyltransferase
MGGGKGSRLFPLTEKRAKPAVPIGGKYRLIDVPISNCLNSGYNRIFVLTQFNSTSLNQHIKNTYRFSLFSKGFVDILAAEQTYEDTDWFEGTADAVRRSLKHLTRVDFDYLLVLSGDHLYDMDYSKMVEFHVKNKGDITIGTVPVTKLKAPGFGILKSNKNNEVLSFIEKPAKEKLPEWSSDVSEDLKKQGKNYLASMGIYIFSKNELRKILSENPGIDFGKEIIPNSITSHKVLSYPFDSFWADIGTVRSFFDMNIGLTEERPEYSLFNERIYTRGRMLPPSKIAARTTLNKTIISDGCIIRADTISRSVIGLNSQIGKGTVIKSSYIMGADTNKILNEITAGQNARKLSQMVVGRNCYIENAILDKNCHICNNVRIKGGDHLEDQDFKDYAVKDGIIIIKKGAKIPEETTIGANPKVAGSAINK